LKHVLFICGKNRKRSPTAEEIFSDWPGVEVTSAGLDNDADNRCTPELVEWADMIFVMERSHKEKLSRGFKKQLKARVICLDIADEYKFMDPKLVELFRKTVSRHLPSTRTGNSYRRQELS